MGPERVQAGRAWLHRRRITSAPPAGLWGRAGAGGYQSISKQGLASGEVAGECPRRCFWPPLRCESAACSKPCQEPTWARAGGQAVCRWLGNRGLRQRRAAWSGHQLTENEQLVIGVLGNPPKPPLDGANGCAWDPGSQAAPAKFQGPPPGRGGALANWACCPAHPSNPTKKAPRGAGGKAPQKGLPKFVRARLPPGPGEVPSSPPQRLRQGHSEGESLDACCPH